MQRKSYQKNLLENYVKEFLKNIPKCMKSRKRMIIRLPTPEVDFMKKHGEIEPTFFKIIKYNATNYEFKDINHYILIINGKSLYDK